jgi:hypothetical protein
MSSNLCLQDQLSIILLLMLDQSTSYDDTPAGRELGLHTGLPGTETVHTS